MRSGWQTIGVLGGAGPLATAHLHLRLIEALQDRYRLADDQDFPSLIVDSQVAPGMTVHGFAESNRSAVFSSLALRIGDLENAGARIILPACNTFAALRADLIRDGKRRQALRARDPLPDRPATLLDLPELALRRAEAQGFTRIAVFCSDTSRCLGVFDERADVSGVEIVPLDDDEQRQVTAAIGSAMSGMLTSDHRLHEVVAAVAERGAEAIVLGCTELSLLPLHDAALPLIDSMSCGIDEAIALSLDGADDARL
jgi:aspartate racemase